MAVILKRNRNLFEVVIEGNSLIGERLKMVPGLVVQACSPALGRLGHKNCHKFETSLVYIVSSKPP